MGEKEHIARSVGIVGFVTVISRIAGYLRDMQMAYFFGATNFTDAYWIAFRIPNLLRRLLAEGSLTISFIPVFTETLEKQGKDEAKKVSDIVFTILFMILIAVSVLGIVFSPYIVKLFAYGFDKETFDVAVSLNRVMFPYIFFVSLAALCMGVLNSLRMFFAPAFSPVLLNLGMIVTVFALHSHFKLPIYSAAIGVIIGGILQLVQQFPYMYLKGFMFSFRKNLRHPAVKRIALLLVPQLFGLAVYNLNLIVSSQYASYMSAGTISYLYYAERLTEFPLGIIAVSIATVLLPSLSSDVSKGNFAQFHDTYNFTLKLLLLILIPSLAGLIALKVPICNVLYQRGEFTYEATLATAQTLSGYCLGLWAVGGLRVTAPAFYAMQDTKTPVVVAFFAFILNAVLGYILGFTLKLEHTCLAIANSCSSIFNFLALIYLLERRTGDLKARTVVYFCLKMILISAVMAGAAWWVSTYADWTGSAFSVRKIAVLALSIAVAGVVFAALTRVLRIEEAGFLLNMLKRKMPAGRES